MSYTKLLYHIIFRTKYSEPSICVENEAHLYRCIWHFIRSKQGVLHRVNGMPDHLHLLVELPAVYPVARFVQDLKNTTHKFIDDHKYLFPTFYAWSVGYCALSYSKIAKNRKLSITSKIRKNTIKHSALKMK